MSEAVEYYLNKMKHGDSENAFFSLIELEHSYVPELIDAYHAEKSPKIQAFLVNVIWEHRLVETLPFLHEALQHQYWNIWQAALDGLYALGHPQGLVILADEIAYLEAQSDNASKKKLEYVQEVYEMVKENLVTGAL